MISRQQFIFPATPPGVKVEPNSGSGAGSNFYFPNGWVVTIQEKQGTTKALTFFSFRGMVRDLNELLEVEDQRSDDKRFLSSAEVCQLFRKVSRLDLSGTISAGDKEF